MRIGALIRGIQSSARGAGLSSALRLWSDFYTLSDGEFVLNAMEVLFPGGAATPMDVERWRGRRLRLIRKIVSARLGKRLRNRKAIFVPYHIRIMGTERFLTPAAWENRIAQVDLAELRPRVPRSRPVRDGFKHSGNYLVSAIASLYKGRRFIETFLDNITSQTIFDRCELIIIDANSPEREGEIIAEYRKSYPNIVYKRVNSRIGVYDAWNAGIELARGKYLTNANVDDMRRCDSFELQARALDRNSSADVVYQDFFYTFDPSLTFNQVARLGFKSELPIITAHNLLTFNSPHNAPMWRRSLHKEVGLFDTSFESAGDWEFWLRCLSEGKGFLKVNSAHVVYYLNPEGVSSGPDSKSFEDTRRILHQYSRRLISRRLLLSREAFAKLLGTEPRWDRRMSYYDVVQDQLKNIGGRYKSKRLQVD